MWFLLLKFAVLDFLDDREFKNVTLKTLQSYRDILKQFENFCLEHDVINVEDITTIIMKRYILHYQKKGNNATLPSLKSSRCLAMALPS
ncbi:phage integrase SAM-like domain-containing protein [Bacillus wiedmannii]|uniref:phage integrase SAM-like domain-containing protein n=1 Tax=Bacillus wiedmannii TaxID=1890302 RepID=UPI0021006601|nr:phage integrase SAM-like domain-containing protein [Bacillus wiedmannii]